MKPCIGVVSLYDIKKKRYWMLPDYLNAIKTAGGIPVILPQIIPKEDMQELIDRLDGFMFAGGQDVAPSLYSEKKRDVCNQICDVRDTMESDLYSLAIKNDKPTFGICRGMQLLNVILGGTLYQDLKTDRPSKIRHCQKYPYNVSGHTVEIFEDTPFYSALNKNEIAVNSYHHQGIKELSPELFAMAKAPDGIIEAVFAKNKRFTVAVQWHPEILFKTDEDNIKIIKSFVKACENK